MLTQLTWLACREEIDRCYQKSKAISFFLSLQGGASTNIGLSLPKYIEKGALGEHLARDYR